MLPGDIPWGLWPAAAALALAAAYLLFRKVRGHRRAETLERTARAQGYIYEAKGDYSFFTGLRGFHLYAQGAERTAHNVLRGRVKASGVGREGELRIILGDYRYRQGNMFIGRSTRAQTVLCIGGEFAALPPFRLRPKGPSLLPGGWGKHVIEFPEHPDFSRHYLLEGKPEKDMRALFDPKVLDHLAAQPGLSIEGGGGRLILYRENRLLAPDSVEATVEEGLRLLSLLRPQVLAAGKAPFIKPREEKP